MLATLSSTQADMLSGKTRHVHTRSSGGPASKPGAGQGGEEDAGGQGAHLISLEER